MRFRPIDTLNGVVLLALAALTLLHRDMLPGAGALLVRFALMAAGLFVVRCLARHEEVRPVAVVREFYPVAFVPLVFESVGPLVPVVNAARYDAALVAWDRALFGADPMTWFTVRPLLTDVLLVAYASYYFLPVILGGFLWALDRAATRRAIFVVCFSFYVSYVGYFLVPARGPRIEFGDPIPLETPASRAVYKSIDFLEGHKYDAFPSGHTMIAVIVLLLAWKHVRPLFWALLPAVAGLVVSTVYCRYHYVVDVIAGLILAFPSAWAGGRIYGRLSRDGGGEALQLLL
ncbi:MAG: phosphatase PAP2 family protein [Planctomycetota bacterium]